MIKWQMTGSDPKDLKAIVPKGMLRVEALNDDIFWWGIFLYKPDAMDAGYEETLKGAKKSCIYRYKQLLKK
jgi:hypothetical protein